MKDVSKRTLAIGQTVATMFDGYTASLQLCTVVGFSPKKVLLVKVNSTDTNQYHKFGEQVCIVDF